MSDGRDDPACFEFVPGHVDGRLAAMGRAVRPDLSPEQCAQHWASLPFVDCSDEALRRYRAWTRSLRATGTVVRP